MLHGGDIYTNEVKYDFSVNLNPAKPEGDITGAMLSGVKRADNYPDIMQRRLRKKLSELEGVSEGEVIAGNGASELISAIVGAEKPKTALVLSPGFSGYRHALCGCSIREIKLRAADSFEAYEELFSDIREDIVFITNPNNPTGRMLDIKLVMHIMNCCRKSGAVLVVDECFLRMSEGSSIKKCINEYEHLYVVDAFTKLFSIPGIRAGYVLSCADNISALRAVLPEWNVSVVAEEAMVFCVRELMNTDFEEKTLEVIRRERKYLSDELLRLGIRVYPSDTSFLLIYSEKELYEPLLEYGILVRNCESFGLEKGFLRIAVKGHEDNLMLINHIEKILR